MGEATLITTVQVNTETSPEDEVRGCNSTKLAAVLIGLLAGFGGLTACGHAEEIEIFRGVPEVKYEITKESSTRDKIKGDMQKSLEVVITKRGEEYYWKSREDRKLILARTAGSPVCYFIDSSGGGSIKVITPSAATSKGIEYIEQISLLGSSIQYFGKGSYFFLDEQRPVVQPLAVSQAPPLVNPTIANQRQPREVLRGMRKIFVAPLGRDGDSKLLEEKIRKELLKSKKFVVVSQPQQADGVVFGAISVKGFTSARGWGNNEQAWLNQDTTYESESILRVADPQSGETVWTWEYDKPSVYFAGLPLDGDSSVSESFVRDLIKVVYGGKEEMNETTTNKRPLGPRRN